MADEDYASLSTEELIEAGTLPPGQTREGFFGGYSIPVNMKLAELFL